MRLGPVLTIYRKELRETFRDKRTLFMMVGLPIVLYPVLGLVFLFAAQSSVEAIDKQPTRVVVAGVGRAMVAAHLAKVKGLSVTEGAAKLDPQAVVRGEEVDVVVVVADPVDSRVRAGERLKFELVFSEVRDRSERGAARVAKDLVALDVALRASGLAARGQPRGLAEAAEIKRTSVATKQEVGGHIAARILPLMLITMLILGAFYPAVELTAGEKERGTLETLLTAPVSRLEIVAGKYLTVVTLSIASAVANLASLSLTIAHAFLKFDPREAAFSIGFSELVIVFLLLIPATLFVSAVMMIVASFARSFKDAQNLLTPVMLVLILPAALFGALPGDTVSASTALVPVMNVVVLTREILEGRATAELVLLVLFASSLFSVAALLVAARIFETEAVYFGGHEVFRDLFRRPAGARRAPTAEVAAVFAVVAFLLLYYVGSWLGGEAPAMAVVLTPPLCVLVPALVAVGWRRLDPKTTFALAWPRASAWAPTALLAGTTWFVALFAVAPLQNQVMPISPELAREMERIVGETLRAFGSFAPVILAIIPAFCEELAFRGLVLGGLLGAMRPAPAVVVSSIVFGVLHLSPHRFLATFLLGLALGALTVRSRSIVPAIVLHAAHNGLAVVFAGAAPSALAYVVFSVLFVAGAGLIAWTRPRCAS